jgi:hypothetical protein
MQFGVKIHDREVIASGVLVLGATDRDMIFNLDGMEFLVRLFPSPTPIPFKVEFVRFDLKQLMIEVHGAFPEFTAAWKLTGVGQAGDRRIDLDLMIFSQGSQPDSIRQVSFTYSATGPAGPTGAPPPAPIRMG